VSATGALVERPGAKQAVSVNRDVDRAAAPSVMIER
jgi:hypothetical protein